MAALRGEYLGRRAREFQKGAKVLTRRRARIKRAPGGVARWDFGWAGAKSTPPADGVL